MRKGLRQYSDSYIEFGFVPSPCDKFKPMCLMCHKVFSNEAMKPSRLKNHLCSIHPDKADKGKSYFKALHQESQKQNTISSMFAKPVKRSNDGLKATYKLSSLIAKQGLPNTVGEKAVLPAIEIVLKDVLHHKNPAAVLKSIPLSNDTVRRRIDEMGTDVEKQLVKILQCNKFSIQIDESTLPSNEALLLMYVRYIQEGEICEELAAAEILKTHTTGEQIFKTIKGYFIQNKIPFVNILACATDGAPSMVGKSKGLITRLKELNPSMLTTHCVIHRQHLVAKKLSPRLHQALMLAVTVVNKIKRTSLRSRLFKQLCEENDENYSNLLYYTEVRWLSSGNCLSRFFSLFDSILEFISSSDEELAGKLIQSKSDIAYLADVYAKFNVLNKTLQGNKVCLPKVKSELSSFNNKLKLYKSNLATGQLFQFSNLLSTSPNPSDMQVYCSHLDQLHADMENRFGDIFSMNIPDWVLDPFNAEISVIAISLQEEFVSLQNDLELKPAFKRSYNTFWLQPQLKTSYPQIWAEIELLFIAFPSSYLVEKAFSAVSFLLNKRPKLDIVNRGSLRLYLTKLEPDIDLLVQQHEAQSSH